MSKVTKAVFGSGMTPASQALAFTKDRLARNLQ